MMNNSKIAPQVKTNNSQWQGTGQNKLMFLQNQYQLLVVEEKGIQEERRAMNEQYMREEQKFHAEEKRINELRALADQQPFKDEQRRITDEQLTKGLRRLAEEKYKQTQQIHIMEARRLKEERQMIEEQILKEEIRLAEQQYFQEEQRIANQEKRVQHERALLEQKQQQEANRLLEQKRADENQFLAEQKRVKRERMLIDLKRTQFEPINDYELTFMPETYPTATNNYAEEEEERAQLEQDYQFQQEQQRQEQQRQEQQRQEQQREEQQRQEQQRQDYQFQQEHQRQEQQRQEQQRFQAEAVQLEQDYQVQQQKEQQRQEQQRQEQQRQEQQRHEQQRQEQQRQEQQRQEQQRQEQQRQEQQRQEQQRQEQQREQDYQFQQQRQEQERQEQQRQEQERQEKARLQAVVDQEEYERQQLFQAEALQLEQEYDRQQKNKAEAAIQEYERQQKIRAEAAKQEYERQQKIKTDAAKQEYERMQRLKNEAAKQEYERQQRIKAEADKQEYERQERIKAAEAKQEYEKQQRIKAAETKQEYEKQQRVKYEEAKQEYEKKQRIKAEEAKQEYEKKQRLQAEAVQKEQERREERKKAEAAQKEFDQQQRLAIKSIKTAENSTTNVKIIDLFSTYFLENIANALAKILRESGIKVNVYVRNITNDDIMKCKQHAERFLFIFCPQTLLQAKNGPVYPSELFVTLPENKYFLYQLEQLDVSSEQKMNKHIISLIKNAKHTFDYSEINLAYYPEQVKEKVSVLLPPIVEWTKNKTLTEKKYDILFCGYMNKRREKILKELRKAGYNVLHVDKVFGAELTQLISEARVFLNIHHSDSKSLETCRLNEAVMSPDTHIVSEKSGLETVDNLYAERVVFTEKEDILKTVKEVLRRSDKEIIKFDIESWKNICIKDYKKPLYARVIIYILSYDIHTYNNSVSYYSKYKWARPIMLTNQNYTFENVFWSQLNNLESEWTDYEMVGVLSHKAYKKIDIDYVNTIIEQKLYKPNKYYNFYKTNNNILANNSMGILSHPNIKSIMLDILNKFNFNSTNECFCNYFMASPFLMKKFITWYSESFLPYLITHPLSFTDSKYISNNKLSDNELIKLWGKPYYPLITFVIERINSCFFENYILNDIKIFLIGHENSLTGAPILLNNINTYLQRNKINTEILFLNDLININIEEYIFKKTTYPILICNTLVTYPIVKKLCNTNVPIYWYVHEWLTDKEIEHYSFIKYDKEIFNNRNVTLLLGCKKLLYNYNLYINTINVPISINYGYNIDSIEKNKKDVINFVKEKHELIISIIGTICHRKNQQSFINDVYYRLKNRYNFIKLMLVGKEYNMLDINIAYRDSIILIGEVENTIPYINISDIIVSYSTSEVMPLNIIESMYCNKPVVSSDVGGISEIIQDGINGYLFKSNDSESCYKKIASLIDNIDLRRNVGIKSKNTFNKIFDENISFKPLLNLIKK